jgi:ribulose-5-phosphate 4-epimerase/fuculose-1-phosphate aldolase
MKEEGVIKFNCNWIQGEPLDAELIHELNTWRDKLYSLKFIGVTEDGIGYGNISVRYQNNQFIITGSGTGAFEKLAPEHYTLVTEYNIHQNSVTCVGPVKASSESLTHAMIYECCNEVNAVFHVHDHALWEKLLETLPSTNANVPYGTPEMAYEIRRLFNEHHLQHHRIFAMGGHEDGVIAFGTTTAETGRLFLS